MTNKETKSLLINEFAGLETAMTKTLLPSLMKTKNATVSYHLFYDCSCNEFSVFEGDENVPTDENGIVEIMTLNLRVSDVFDGKTFEDDKQKEEFITATIPSLVQGAMNEMILRLDYAIKTEERRKLWFLVMPDVAS